MSKAYVVVVEGPTDAEGNRGVEAIYGSAIGGACGPIEATQVQDSVRQRLGSGDSDITATIVEVRQWWPGTTPDPSACPNPWHQSAPARATMTCPECPAHK